MATELAPFASEPVARLTPSELGGKFPKKLLHGPLADPLEPDEPLDPDEPADPVEPRDPLDPTEPADWAFAVTGTSREVTTAATGTVRRSEVRAGRSDMRKTLSGR